MQRTLIVFVKAPVAGRVKTRLAGSDENGVGAGRAAALFRTMTAGTIAAARVGPWRTVLAVSPGRRPGGYGGLWPTRLPQTDQGRGDLGARLSRAIAAAPSGPVVVLGADAPTLRARHIAAAFRALGAADAVFGPASDGGFYLLGLARRRAAPRVFDGVRWSTKHALRDVADRLPKGFATATLETLDDLDEPADLARAPAWAFRRASMREGFAV